MKITWEITDDDVAQVSNLVKSFENNPFVIERRRRNLERQRPELKESILWRVLIGCLLTTQQRSSPDSPINKFLNSEDFPLDYEKISNFNDIASQVEKKIRVVNGIRFAPKLSNQISENFDKLEKGGWKDLLDKVKTLNDLQDPDKIIERESAKKIAELKGFGPKQSRNFLQWLGLTQYEICLDSRVIKWLSKIDFPDWIGGATLSEDKSYNFILDKVQEICARADIKPCILDAAIFAEADKNRWNESNVRENWLYPES